VTAPNKNALPRDGEHSGGEAGARLYRLRAIWAFVIYALLDVVCVGAGMGLPV
jgi:hypothetical protein